MQSIQGKGARKTKEQIEYIIEQEFILEHNKAYGQIIREERSKRKLSLEDLSCGIMSRTALEKVEKGKAQWTKLAGDTLMLRMGILPEHFESLSSGEDLDRWRLREDICLLVPDEREQAVAKIQEYRETYGKREPLEEQFLLKAEVVLMLLQNMAESGEAWRRDGRACPRVHMESAAESGSRIPVANGTGARVILEKARQALECTVRPGWEQQIGKFALSPGELEAVLLVSAALLAGGGEAEEAQEAQAWALWQAVWEYPGGHGWTEGAKMLILPQAAVFGIRLAYASGRFSDALVHMGISEEDMAARGQEALELLRRNGGHCHALPLLDALCGMRETLFGEAGCQPGYPEQIRRFREMFREIYEWFGYPGYRMWQGISVDNTRDAGSVLKMLRTFYGKSREEAVHDGDERVVTPRQLEKIEKGIHKPSYENYRRLVKQYGKYGEWNMPLLETDSLEVLKLRQEISKLIEFNEWEHVEWEIQRFRKLVNPEYPKVRQELLFFDAALKWKKENALQESLEMMLEALHCTVPDFGGRDMKWWVFQREEIIIASDIAELYHKLGNLEEAKKWYEAVLFSVEQNCARTDTVNCGYDLVALGYSDYLGDVHSFKHAIELSEATARKDLAFYRINCIRYLFYHIAWNACEAASEKPERYESLRRKWRKAFEISESLADYMYDSHLSMLLKQRETKYLA